MYPRQPGPEPLGPPLVFLKQVRRELANVAWPGRQEMISYTVVVLVAVVFLTAMVFGMDLMFVKAVLHIFGQS
jgi:preprotein translocase subunit SecE